MFSLRPSKPPSASRERKKLPEVEDLKTEEQIEQGVAAAVAGLGFEAFDIPTVRELAREAIPLGSLMVLLSAYVSTGNSLSTRMKSQKVTDAGMAESVVKLMKEAGIKEKATTSTDLTLPRLAICFPGLVIWIRMKSKPAPRVVTSTPIHLQDICLNGWQNTLAASGCEDFIEKFAVLLGRAQAKPPLVFDEAACKAKSLAFRAIGISGQARDALGVAAMAAPVLETTKLFDLAAKYGYKPR